MIPRHGTYINTETGEIIETKIGEGYFKIHDAGYGDPCEWGQDVVLEGYEWVENGGRYEFEYDENE